MNTYDKQCVLCVYRLSDKYGKLDCEKRSRIKVKTLKQEKSCQFFININSEKNEKI